MRRDRFEVIIKCLHFKDNNKQDKNDKYSKIRPFLDHLEEKFIQHFIPSQKISHDEAMILAGFPMMKQRSILAGTAASRQFVINQFDLDTKYEAKIRPKDAS